MNRFNSEPLSPTRNNLNRLITTKRLTHCGDRVDEFKVKAALLTAETVAKLHKLTVESIFLTSDISNEGNTYNILIIVNQKLM